ncbi:citrate synthase family protein [Aquibium sp. LZ166]|uniref:citrate synthase (unknown stereospecificity) n=1 Tax=Aquibium pacificus TaxID=3153579 RepID=A0ABV3SKF7_9HYPH
MKKIEEPLYLNAREAAGELGVSPATLYAYVSRGLIRSEPVPDTRARRYRADDVRALKNRRAPSGTAREPASDMPVIESSISTITEAGPIYRGVPAVALAEQGTLEQAATLLWGIDSIDPFEPDNLPELSGAMRIVAGAIEKPSPIARAVAVLSLAGDGDPRAFNRTRDGRAQVGARVMRLVTSAILERAPGSAPLHRQVAQAWTPDDRKAEDLFRRALVLLADHELNASSFTVRCAASTGLNLYDATIAGLVALKGPKHGGAGPLAAHLVADLAEGDMARNIRERVALGEPMPGFGHTVYERGDPRAEHLLAELAKSGDQQRLAVDAPAMITEATGLHPNIDFALAVMMRSLGLAIGHELALFAIARTAGWVAHAMEQLATGTLIRPRARYVGPVPGRT